MLSKKQTKLLENVISIMDSFQQDNGKIYYSVNIGSYPTGHRIIVRAYNYDENKSIEFVIDETNEANLYAIFEQKTKIVLGEDIPYKDREYHLEKKEFDPPKPKFEAPDKIQSPFIGVE